METQVQPFKTQLLKWVGNKQRFAHEIASYFPIEFNTYYEPFLGSGAVLATLAPVQAVGSDVFRPLIELWQVLHDSPETLVEWYAERRAVVVGGDKVAEYEKIKASYNASPNPADFLFLCRSCYGGVVRFSRANGHMSTACGSHTPISADEFATRVQEWHRRTKGAAFLLADFEEVMSLAGEGDLVYCDPPYTDSQAMIYGAHAFSLVRLFRAIIGCKSRGAKVVLSLDGTKRSGDKICNFSIPNGIFEHEALVNCGRSMLKRFQMGGQTLEGEEVADRLLLTY